MHWFGKRSEDRRLGKKSKTRWTTNQKKISLIPSRGEKFLNLMSQVILDKRGHLLKRTVIADYIVPSFLLGISGNLLLEWLKKIERIDGKIKTNAQKHPAVGPAQRSV